MINLFIIWLARSGICTIVGIIAGSFTGLLFGPLLLGAPKHQIPVYLAAGLGLILGLLSWLLVLWMLGVMTDYIVGDVALPVLLNCLLASTLTALWVNFLHRPYLAMPLGWIIGFAVGRLLCVICGTSPLGLKRAYSPDQS